MPLSFNTDDKKSNASSSASYPEAFSRVCQDTWRLCGEGVFSWSVFRFYRARLLTHTGTFDSDKPFLLDLHYLRSLTGQQIVSTSMDEIARIHPLNEEQRRRWTAALESMIPDVCLGDRLLGWFVPGNRVDFFSSSDALGEINDPEFVRMFSSIWLDEKTRSPQLREALLGEVRV